MISAFLAQLLDVPHSCRRLMIYKSICRPDEAKGCNMTPGPAFAGFGFIQPDDAPEEPEGAAQHDLFVHQVRKVSFCGCRRQPSGRQQP